MSEKANPEVDQFIYRDFCNGMKLQSREQVRLLGEIARRAAKGITLTKQTETLNTAFANFCQVETNLENIENNLNKVCALSRQAK